MTDSTNIQPANPTTGWYGAFTPEVKRTFWACFGGWALDAMDVQIFSFAIPAIIAAFHISKADAGLIEHDLYAWTIDRYLRRDRLRPRHHCGLVAAGDGRSRADGRGIGYLAWRARDY